MEVIIKHTTTDGNTYHEVDLSNRKHRVTTLETSESEEFTSTKKWGSQEKFVDKLVLKEIESVEAKMLIQKKTIADCIYYKSEDHLDVTKRKLDENRELLEFLKTFNYHGKDKK
jgi:transcriptional regulator NrdR family protein